MKLLLLIAALLQGLTLHVGNAAIITSGRLQVPIDGLGDGRNPLHIAGDGFALNTIMVATLGDLSSSRIVFSCCYPYGSTFQPFVFDLVAAARYDGGLTDGILFNGVQYNETFLFGRNFTFAGQTPEDRLQQNSERPSVLRITASSIVFPNPGVDVPVGQGQVLTGTFELTGSLCGYPIGSGTFGSQPCVFDLPTVYGRGTYEVKTSYGVYQGPNLRGYWALDSQSFVFTFADPGADVPEPGTWTMLAAGILGLALFRRGKGVKQ